MKKILVVALALITLFCFGIGLTACKEEPKVVLVNFENQTIDIGYGEEYLLDLTVEDTSGNVYNISSSVKTAGGRDVTITNGKFVANEKTDYIITYKFVKGEQTETRVVTAKVVAKKAPAIIINALDGILVKGMDATLPTATAYDYFDGDLDYTVKVFKEVAEGEDVELPVSEGKFNVVSSGRYYAEYTAVNSYGVVGSAKIYYDAKEASELISLVKVIDGTQGAVIYNNDVASTFVAAGDDAIKDFKGDYTGNAVAFKIASNPNYRVKCNYSAEVVSAIGQEYDSVSMWIAADGIPGGTATMMYASHIEGYASIQWQAMGEPLSLVANQKQWIRITMDTEDFAEICGINEYINLFYIYVESKDFDYSNTKVYVGDIEFHKSIPEITIASNGGLFVKDATLKVPTATVIDKFDGTLDYTVKAYKMVDDGNDVEVVITGGKFTPTEVGTYCVEYSATNTNGITGKASVYYDVKDASEFQSLAKVVDGTQGTTIYNSDLTGTFVAAGDDAIKNFAGDYNGNAVAFNVATNPNYRLRCNYSVELLTALKAKYNRVSMWVAVDGIASGNAYMMSNGAQDFNSFQYAATKSNYGFATRQEQWIRFTITIDDLIELKDTNDNIRLFYIWTDGLVKEEGFDAAKVYVGDIEFYYEAPTILTIDSSNYSNIYLEGNKPASSYVAAGDDAIKDFAGDYDGNATKLSAFTNNHYRFVNPYSLEELTALKVSGTVDTVSVYFAFGGLTAGSARFEVPSTSCPDTFLNRAGIAGNKWFAAEVTTASHLPMNTWHKFSISLSDYVALVTDDSGDTLTAKAYCPLMATWFWESQGTLAYYVGDIILEKTPQYPNVTNKDVSSTNVTATEWAADGITGDYTGTAKKFHMTGANSGFKYANPYSQAELETMKSTYSTVTLKFAVSIKVGTFYLFDTGFEGIAAPGTTSYREANGNLNTWVTWTVSLEDYIELVSANNYEYFSPWTNAYSEGIVEGGITVYFGELTVA